MTGRVSGGVAPRPPVFGREFINIHMLDRVKEWLSAEGRQASIQEGLDKLRDKSPIPILWLFGKTQSGKSSLVRFLTGAADAEIGEGFRPCTKHSRQYDFPTAESPLLRFLDTRGLDEPGYDPTEDLQAFDASAQVVVVTTKLLDFAQENCVRHLRALRKAQPLRPILLLATCLHEAYPLMQHPEVYPFIGDWRTTWLHDGKPLPEQPEHPCVAVDGPVRKSLLAHEAQFGDLIDAILPIDLTRAEEGFRQPNFGGDALKRELVNWLPRAFRQSLLMLDEARNNLGDAFSRHVLPHILGYSSLAATAGAVPVPFLDLLLLPAIQARMIYHLARVYGQPLTGARFLEVASSLGLGLIVQQASREILKLIPFVGSIAGGLVAGASTLALGKAFCYYYSAMHAGQVPRPEDLRRYYHEQFRLAEQFLRINRKAS
jgi:uncharacterized protein (DUF697 family)